jgi:predicted flap endonuclease-1-like 5' DNA nuclease
MIGVIEIIRGITGEGWAEVILGIVSIILGGLLLANFWGVTISLPWSLGILSLIGGAIAIFNAFRARGIQKDMEAGTDELTNKYRATVATADAKIDAAADRVRAAGGATAAAAAATGAAGVAAAERAARSTGDALSDAANATVAGVDRAVDSAADAVGDAYDATADAVGDAWDATTDAVEDAGDAVGDMASRAGNAINIDTPAYNIPAAAGALTAEDKLAITSWAREKGIGEDEIQRIMASPYGDLLSRGKTPAERAVLARDMGVDTQKILTYLNLADLQRIDGVGVVYAYLLEESGVDTVKELATRNPANLTAKLAEVNAVRGITKRVPPQGEVEKWVAEAKTLPPALEY